MRPADGLAAPQPELERIVQLAASLCAAPMAALSLDDGEQQRLLPRVGIEPDRVTRDGSLCAQAMLQREPLVVADARAEPRFANAPLVDDAAGVRFYAGLPLHDREGVVLGTLAVMDSVPRSLSNEQLIALEVLARQASQALQDAHRLCGPAACSSP